MDKGKYHFTLTSSFTGKCEGSVMLLSSSLFWTESSSGSESDNDDKSMISSEPSLLSEKTSLSASGSVTYKINYKLKLIACTFQ